MASFNEQNTNLLSFLSGLSQGFAPAYIKAGDKKDILAEKEKTRKLARDRQKIDNDRYKRNTETVRLRNKANDDYRVETEKGRAADRVATGEYRAAKLKGDNKYRDDMLGDRALDRKSRERITRLRTGTEKTGRSFTLGGENRDVDSTIETLKALAKNSYNAGTTEKKGQYGGVLQKDTMGNAKDEAKDYLTLANYVERVSRTGESDPEMDAILSEVLNHSSLGKKEEQPIEQAPEINPMIAQTRNLWMQPPARLNTNQPIEQAPVPDTTKPPQRNRIKLKWVK